MFVTRIYMTAEQIKKMEEDKENEIVDQCYHLIMKKAKRLEQRRSLNIKGDNDEAIEQ